MFIFFDIWLQSLSTMIWSPNECLGLIKKSSWFGHLCSSKLTSTPDLVSVKAGCGFSTIIINWSEPSFSREAGTAKPSAEQVTKHQQQTQLQTETDTQLHNSGSASSYFHQSLWWAKVFKNSVHVHFCMSCLFCAKALSLGFLAKEKKWPMSPIMFLYSNKLNLLQTGGIKV